MMSLTLRLILVLSCISLAQAQENESVKGVLIDDQTLLADPVAPDAVQETKEVRKSDKSALENAKDAAVEWEEKTAEEVEKLAKKVDQEPMAKTAAAGILQPIYAVAETLAFPAFHWIAFALMASGVVSYSLQLVLGKLIVLSRMGFSFKEIASDAVGLAISIFGLVLTTQAAAENSSFTQSPFAVISATVVGFIVGVILYFWGQSQELQAAAGRAKVMVHR